MNYYRRHIGDYLKDTSHLSLLEHGVYTRLMDVYYTREAPIPEGGAARLIGARSPEEREALESVLREFFQLEGKLWYQSRCDEEIAAHEDYAASQSAKGKASAAARRLKTDSTEKEPELNSGSTVAANTSTAEEHRLNSGSTEGQPPTPTPTPISKNNVAIATDTRERGVKIPLPFAVSDEMRAWCQAECPAVSVDSATVEFCDYWRAIPGAKGRKSDWPATWRNRMREMQARVMQRQRFDKPKGKSEWM